MSKISYAYLKKKKKLCQPQVGVLFVLCHNILQLYRPFYALQCIMYCWQDYNIFSIILDNYCVSFDFKFLLSNSNLTNNFVFAQTQTKSSLYTMSREIPKVHLLQVITDKENKQEKIVKAVLLCSLSCLTIFIQNTALRLTERQKHLINMYRSI